MAGKVNLGNDIDVTCGCVFHKFAQLFPGVKSTVGCGIIGGAVPALACVNLCGVAQRADFGEQWVFLALEPPSLVFGEVEMEFIHVVESQNVDIFLYRVEGEEMAAGVEMGAAVCKTGIIVDFYRREHHRFRGNIRNRFADGLHAIEHAGSGAACKPHARTVDHQPVAFGIADGWIDRKCDAVVAGGSGPYGEFQPCHFFKIFLQKRCFVGQFLLIFRVGDHGACIQREPGGIRCLDLLRKGHHTVVGRDRRACTESHQSRQAKQT